MSALRPRCAETLRWAATQIREALEAQGLGYGDSGPVVELARDANSRLADQWNRLEGELRDQKRRIFYFGTWKGPGHYWHRPGGEHAWDAAQITPFASPDGTHQPDNREIQGPAALHHEDGWTLLAWWDRFEDKRSACCSALAWEGEVSFGAMDLLLRTHFPHVAARRKLTQWTGRTKKDAR